MLKAVKIPSRVGKIPIVLPPKVHLEQKGCWVRVSGPRGALFHRFEPVVAVQQFGEEVTVTMAEESVRAKAYQGTTRSLLHNMIRGVTTGHAKILTLVGVGYRASLEEKMLCLNVGFCDTKRVSVPEDIKVILSGSTTIVVFGNDKQRVGVFASMVRKLRKPEPYKGKGIRYIDEIVKLKQSASKK